MGAEQSELVFETVALAGEILVSSGAEIFRVTETMERIAAAYGCEGFEPFVLSNGIMMTASDGRRHCLAKVRHIPLSGSRLDKVDAVNQLSREIAQGMHTPEEAHARLLEIQNMPRRPRWQQVLARAVITVRIRWIYRVLHGLFLRRSLRCSTDPWYLPDNR